jgi:hypothetical protein
MAHELSPHNEQFIRDSLATGVYPTREALLNSAVDALRHVSDRGLAEELRLVDEAFDEYEAQGSVPWNPQEALQEVLRRMSSSDTTR